MSDYVYNSANRSWHFWWWLKMKGRDRQSHLKSHKATHLSDRISCQSYAAVTILYRKSHKRRYWKSGITKVSSSGDNKYLNNIHAFPSESCLIVLVWTKVVDQLKDQSTEISHAMHLVCTKKLTNDSLIAMRSFKWLIPFNIPSAKSAQCSALLRP